MKMYDPNDMRIMHQERVRDLKNDYTASRNMSQKLRQLTSKWFKRHEA